MTRPVQPVWVAADARGGGRIGVAHSPAEHPGCLDVVRQLAYGYEVLARLRPSEAAALVAAISDWTEEHR